MGRHQRARRSRGVSATRRHDGSSHRGCAVRSQRTIHVVRHGQTEFNRLGRLQGSSDPPLNAAGREQARRAAEQLAAAGVRSVVSSPMARASQTADAIRAVAGVSATEDPRLRERGFGCLEGATVAELRCSDPDLVTRLTEDRQFAPAGGESRATVASRVRDFIAALLSGDGHVGGSDGTAVVVHGGWCDVATSTVLSGPRRGCPRLRTGEVRRLLVTELLDEAGNATWVVDAYEPGRSRGRRLEPAP